MKNNTLADLEWEKLEALITWRNKKESYDLLDHVASEQQEQDRADENYNSPEFNQ